MAALYICTESFTGTLPATGSLKTFYQGTDVLDADQPAEAALLKIWGSRFKPIASTHVYTEADIAKAKSIAKGVRTRKRHAKAKAEEQEPEPAAIVVPPEELDETPAESKEKP